MREQALGMLDKIIDFDQGNASTIVRRSPARRRNVAGLFRRALVPTC